MKYKYIAIRPDEDGNCVRFLDNSALKEMLEEAEDYNFLSEEDLEKKGTDPQYWSESPQDTMLIKIDKIVVPKPIVTKWRIEDE